MTSNRMSNAKTSMKSEISRNSLFVDIIVEDDADLEIGDYDVVVRDEGYDYAGDFEEIIQVYRRMLWWNKNCKLLKL